MFTNDVIIQTVALHSSNIVGICKVILSSTSGMWTRFSLFESCDVLVQLCENIDEEFKLHIVGSNLFFGAMKGHVFLHEFRLKNETFHVHPNLKLAIA